MNAQVSSSAFIQPLSYKLTYNYTVSVYEPVISLEIWIPLPTNWDSQNNVVLLQTYPSGAQAEDIQQGNRVLHWDLGPLSAGSSRTVMMQLTFTAYNIQYYIDPSKVGAYNKTSPDYLQYTKTENYIEAAYPPIVQKAKQLVGNETNPYLQARILYNWVMQYMRYQVRGPNDSWGAKFAFDNGHGECTEYSALFAALARAVGIPARLVLGLYWSKTGVYPWGSDRGIHAWAEFFLPNYGWIPADATLAQANDNPYAYFGGHPSSNQFLIMSKGVNFQLRTDQGDHWTQDALQTGTYYYSYRDTNPKPSDSYKYSIRISETPVPENINPLIPLSIAALALFYYKRQRQNYI